MTSEAWIVVDLGFGDAGKGATVDFLVRDRRAGLVVRFNGGAQAGHTVLSPDGVHHTFSQFGAGTFVEDVRTLLGPTFVLHPGAILVEERHLQRKGVRDALDRTLVDCRALVVSPFQQAACRLWEMNRGVKAHGTCGVGIGECVRDALDELDDTIRVEDLENPAEKLVSQQRRIRARLEDLRQFSDVRAETEWAVLDDRRAIERTIELWSQLSGRLEVLEPAQTRRVIVDTDVVVFEGAQGVLLDQDVGFHPHTTWSDCTPTEALRLIAGSNARVRRLGVIRAYMVRHGPGPFPTHAPTSRLNLQPEPDNSDDGWQGTFRRGPLDCVLLRYAIESSGGVDGIAMSCLDHVDAVADVCTAYRLGDETIQRLPVPAPGDHRVLERLGRSLESVEPVLSQVPVGELEELVESELGIPVWIIADGPSSRNRRWRADI